MTRLRSTELYIKDMVLSIERILEYVGDLDFDVFETNYMVVDAVVRNFEILGEAAKKVPQSIKDQHSEIPWKEMNILRNIATHEYFGIDHATLWKIIEEHLPRNLEDLKKVMEKL